MNINWPRIKKADMSAKGRKVLALYCYRCGKKGNIVKVKERFLKQLDLYYFQCLRCEARWYEPDQVIAIIATLKDQVTSQ